jgi:hypothetical protein
VNLRAFIAAACAAMIIIPPSASARQATASPADVRAAEARSAAQESLHALRTRTSATDTQWYGNGDWHFANEDPWFTEAGPATLEATLWRVDGRRAALRKRRSIRTFDRLIREYRDAKGSFGGDAVATEFFANELATTYLVLGNSLDSRHRAAWRAAIAGAAQFLITNGDIHWEANGNVNLGETEFEWLAWAITGDDAFHDAYETAWTYVISPPQKDWPGYGLHLTRRPTRADGADGAGYLAENGGNGPGFDPEYTMLQLSLAARGYVLTGDPRFLRLANLIWNQLRPLTSRPGWILDAQNGSRRSHIDNFNSAGILVLATQGRRTDLNASLRAQTQQMYTTYLDNAELNWGNAGYYRGYGLDLGTALLAVAAPSRGGVRAANSARTTQSAQGTADASVGLVKGRIGASLVGGSVRIWWSTAGALRGGAVLQVDGGRDLPLARHSTMVELPPGLHQLALRSAGGGSVVATTVVTVPLAAG